MKSIGVLAVFALLLWLFLRPVAWGGDRIELSAEADEAAHYVTALMIHDYVAEAPGSAPRQFAERYYVHYPKLAFGVWPPLFHVALAGWLLTFGPSMSSALIFIALTTTGVIVVMVIAFRRSLGVPLALASTVWFATLPVVQASTASVMMDMLGAFFMLAAAVAFGRYLDSERTRYALAFAVLASAGLMTKYNALSLVLLPPLAVMASHRWSILRKPSFWSMPLVVVALCGPWYYVQWQMVLYAADPGPSGFTWWRASYSNVRTILQQSGLLATPLIVLGVYQFVVRRPHRDHGTWCSLFSLMVAVCLFHSLLYPHPGGRYLLPAFAAMALFAAGGLHWIARQCLSRCEFQPAQGVRLTAVVLAGLSLAAWSPVPQEPRGFAEAASFVLERHTRSDVTTLVSSDGMGEGAFVAEVAARERRPASIVLRGSKLLASGTWMAANYAPRYADTAGVLEALDRARVGFVVLDDELDHPHHRLLDQAVVRSSEWTLVHRVPSARAGTSDVRVYTRIHPLPPGVPRFELDMQYSLGYSLSQ